MAGNKQLCAFPECHVEALAGHAYCPAHVSEEVGLPRISPQMADSLKPLYDETYTAAVYGSALDAYRLCARGYKVAAWYYNGDGDLGFCLVLE